MQRRVLEGVGNIYHFSHCLFLSPVFTLSLSLSPRFIFGYQMVEGGAESLSYAPVLSIIITTELENKES